MTRSPRKPAAPTPGSQRITQPKLGAMVASRIKDHIIAHALKEGDRLPTEQQFAEMFGVSRLSVREATRSLAFLGIIKSAPRRGLTLGRVDMNQVAEFLGFHFAMSGYPRDQLVAARLAIESGAMAAAAERIATDPALYDHLMALNETLREARDIETFITRDIAFHRALIASSGIEPLIAFSSLLEVFFSRFKEDLRKARAGWVNGIADHQRILAALRTRDVDAAKAVFAKHFSTYRDGR